MVCLVFVAACDPPPPPRVQPPVRDFAECEGVHPVSATPDFRTCELLGSSPVVVDVSVDPGHCGACYRACEGCADGLCPSDAPSTVRIGSPSHDVVRDLAASADRVAVVGEFSLPEEDEELFAIQLGEEFIPSQGGVDGLVAVYDSALRMQWSATVGGDGDDDVRRVAVAADGSVIIAGSFWGSALVDGSRISGDARDGFVANFSSEGRLRWVQTVTGPDEERVLALALDGEGNVLIGGTSTGAEIRIGESRLRPPGAAAGAWMASLSASGSFRWGHAFGGDPRLAEYDITEYASLDDIAVSPEGVIVAVGYVGENADFGEGPRASMGSFDGFVVALNRDGALRWVRSPYARITSDYVDRVGALPDGTFVVNGDGPTRNGYPTGRVGLMRLDSAGNEVALDGQEIVRGEADLVRLRTSGFEGAKFQAAEGGGVLYAAVDLSRIGNITHRDIVLARLPCSGQTCPVEWFPERCDVTPVACGDGREVRGELCDRGVENGMYGQRCAFDCLGEAARCGDRVVQPEFGEACDGREREDGTVCNNTCQWGTRDTCGDGMRMDREICFPTSAGDPVFFNGEPVHSVTAGYDHLIVQRGSPETRLTLLGTVGSPATWSLLMDRVFEHPALVPAFALDSFIMVGGECADCAGHYDIAPPQAMRTNEATPNWTAATSTSNTSALVAHENGFTWFNLFEPVATTTAHGLGEVRAMASRPRGDHVVLVLHEGALALYDLSMGAITARWSVPVDATSIDAIAIHDLDNDGVDEAITISGDPAIAQPYEEATGTLLTPMPLHTGRATLARTMPILRVGNALVVGDATGLHAFAPGATRASWSSTFACRPRDVTHQLRGGVAVLLVATDCGLVMLVNDL